MPLQTTLSLACGKQVPNAVGASVGAQMTCAAPSMVGVVTRLITAIRSLTVKHNMVREQRINREIIPRTGKIRD